MDEARAWRLQPHYIDACSATPSNDLAMDQPTRVAAGDRQRAGPNPELARYQPIATKYDRVTFDLEHVQADELARADLLAPGIRFTMP